MEFPIGKYVLVRSRNEGINAGVLLSADKDGCHLDQARRLWYHVPPVGAWYESVALRGATTDSQVSIGVEKYIVEDYSLTVCSAEAEAIIRGLPAYKE